MYSKCASKLHSSMKKMQKAYSEIPFKEIGLGSISKH